MRLTPKVEDHPLSDVLLYVFAVSSISGSRVLLPWEDAPCFDLYCFFLLACETCTLLDTDFLSNWKLFHRSSNSVLIWKQTFRYRIRGCPLFYVLSFGSFQYVPSIPIPLNAFKNYPCNFTRWPLPLTISDLFVYALCFVLSLQKNPHVLSNLTSTIIRPCYIRKKNIIKYIFV
jgi:hypothetical protein